MSSLLGRILYHPIIPQEISRYEPPKPVKQKEREDLIKKVKEMTGEGIKGGEREKSVEVDTDLSWDHEGLKPLPKAPRDRLDKDPKPPRVPKAPRAETKGRGSLQEGVLSQGGGYNRRKRPRNFLRNE